MADPCEQKLQGPRRRSLAVTRHRFIFFDANHQAVFPIVKKETAGAISLYGTGFFVAPGGVFASAKHVFEGADIHESESFHILQEAADHVEPRRITEVVVDAASDLAVGRLDPAHGECVFCEAHPVVGIMELDPEIHEVVGSYTFSHTLIDQPEDIGVEQKVGAGQRVLYRAHWEVGTAEAIHPNGLGFVKGCCFSSSILVEGRASGGPVFNSNGFVVGVNSRSFTKTGGLPHSTASSIKRLYDIEIGGRSIRNWRRGVKNDRIAYRTSIDQKAENRPD